MESMEAYGDTEVNDSISSTAAAGKLFNPEIPPVAVEEEDVLAGRESKDRLEASLVGRVGGLGSASARK